MTPPTSNDRGKHPVCVDDDSDVDDLDGADFDYCTTRPLVTADAHRQQTYSTTLPRTPPRNLHLKQQLLINRRQVLPLHPVLPPDYRTARTRKPRTQTSGRSLHDRWKRCYVIYRYPRTPRAQQTARAQVIPTRGTSKLARRLERLGKRCLSRVWTMHFLESLMVPNQT